MEPASNARASSTVRPGLAARPARVCERLARTSAAFAVLLGAAVSFGWLAGISWLQDPVGDFVRMSPYSALSFVAVGLALRLALAPASSAYRRFARVLAAVTLVLALLMLGWYAFGSRPGSLPWTLSAEPMSFASALAFALVAVALLLIDVPARRGARPSELLALLALVPGSLTIGGYVFGATQFYASSRYPHATGMALHSAIGLVVVALGVFVSRVGSGLMAVVASPFVGGRVVRRVLTVVAAIPVIGFLAVLGQRAELYASPGASVVATVASMFVAGGVALALGRSIEASDARRRAIESELRQWEEFFRGASFGAAVGSLDGRLSRVNEAFARMHGWTVAELEGRPTTDVVAPSRREELDRCIALAHRTGRCRWESEHVRKDGSVFPVLIDLAAIRDANGDVVYRAASIQDMSEEKRAEADRARLAAIVESADDAIIANALDGTVLAWNRGAERMFGFSAAQMIGRPIEVVVPEDRRDEAAAIRAAVLAGERVTSFETVRVRKDGQRLPIALTLSPIRDDAGRIIGISTIDRDVSALKELEREREEWTSVVAHDLRQPATAIRIAGAVLDRADGRAREKAVERIRSASARLDRMIDDLLDASRTAAERLSVRSDRVSLAEVVETAMSQLPDAARRCEVHLAPRCPDAMGDAARLVQVVSNLVSNAAKYGYPDSPIELRAEEAAGGMVELSVTNEGPGIAPDDVPRLFSRFVRTPAAQRSTTPGLGLGLYICRGLVEAHGGRLWVESVPGETTSFHFTVPAAERLEAHPTP